MRWLRWLWLWRLLVDGERGDVVVDVVDQVDGEVVDVVMEKLM